MNRPILHTTLLSSLLCASSLLYAEDGILALTTDPPNAEIYVDGQLKTNLTPVVLHLPTGKHLIEAKKDNQSAKLEVLISDNLVVHNKMVLVSLPPPPPKEEKKESVPKKPGESFKDQLKDGNFGPEMVIIPAGKFRMGDLRGVGATDEQPVHEVSVKSFAMSRHEVTFNEYDYFAAQTRREKPSDNGWERGNRPVINVSWDDATAYADWLSGLTGESYRLPSEAEWEYAARAGTVTDYWWGSEIGINRANCGGSSSQWSGQQTAPVGSFAPNPFGLHDMLGNVWEWTCSEYEQKYSGKELECIGKNHANEDSRPRVIRGGAWYNVAQWLRASSRTWNARAYRNNEVGFRLARRM